MIDQSIGAKREPPYAAPLKIPDFDLCARCAARGATIIRDSSRSHRGSVRSNRSSRFARSKRCRSQPFNGSTCSKVQGSGELPRFESSRNVEMRWPETFTVRSSLGIIFGREMLDHDLADLLASKQSGQIESCTSTSRISGRLTMSSK